MTIFDINPLLTMREQVNKITTDFVYFKLFYAASPISRERGNYRRRAVVPRALIEAAVTAQDKEQLAYLINNAPNHAAY